MKDTDTVILAFTGTGHQFGGIPVDEFHKGIQKEEFQKLKGYSEYTYKSFIDRQTSWFNNIDVNELYSLVEGYNKVITLGNSMGAFSAIMFSNFHPVDLVIAFAPQYSVHPDTPPFDKRYDHYKSYIKEWKYKHLVFNTTTKYHIIFGDDIEESKHMELIPKQPNITIEVIENADHNVAAKLRDEGTLYTKIDNLIKSM